MKEVKTFVEVIKLLDGGSVKVERMEYTSYSAAVSSHPSIHGTNPRRFRVGGVLYLVYATIPVREFYRVSKGLSYEWNKATE